ncbi:hypothetical protein BUALT_Bualt11G0021900 [Buddleja alternifolia]|uniref:Uncharacterized protein n=1 Tax=Buddleja alternifolia TaxID=168488 RepID=A0AAV6WWU6_9LAMI|nr:hypothetical protein BUALT_Bualt11G0021900 [Buddleja alternifolia]
MCYERGDMVGVVSGAIVSVANELGAGNGKEAQFATIVPVIESIVIGLFFWVLIMLFHNEIALTFASNKPVLEAVSKLSLLLAFTVLLNSVQPILSGWLLVQDGSLMWHTLTLVATIWLESPLEV